MIPSGIGGGGKIGLHLRRNLRWSKFDYGDYGDLGRAPQAEARELLAAGGDGLAAGGDVVEGERRSGAGLGPGDPCGGGRRAVSVTPGRGF